MLIPTIAVSVILLLAFIGHQSWRTWHTPAPYTVESISSTKQGRHRRPKGEGPAWRQTTSKFSQATYGRHAAA